jgi:hypothetical protein
MSWRMHEYVWSLIRTWKLAVSLDAGQLFPCPAGQMQAYSSSEAIMSPAPMTRTAPTIPAVCKGSSPSTKKARTAVQMGMPVKIICNHAQVWPFFYPIKKRVCRFRPSIPSDQQIFKHLHQILGVKRSIKHGLAHPRNTSSE